MTVVPVSFPGFLAFLRNEGVPVTALPDTSQDAADAYAVAIETVNKTLLAAAPNTYALAVYNYGASYLLNYATDQTGQTYFRDFRRSLNLQGPLLGPLTSTSDEGTSVSVQTPDFVKDLSLADVVLLGDPFGRRYLMLAQKAGSIWGLS